MKNVHPQTNKTTLKGLLSSAFVDDDLVVGTAKGKEVDYVDYQKNMETVRDSYFHFSPKISPALTQLTIPPHLVSHPIIPPSIRRTSC